MKNNPLPQFAYFVCASIVMLAELNAPAYAQNLLVNGSFENGNFTGSNPAGHFGSTQLLPGSTNLTGWTIQQGGSDIDWLTTPNFGGTTAENGSFYLDLTGFTDNPPYAIISQTLVLNPGSTYSLSLWLGCQEGGNPGFAGPVGVSVSVGSLNQSYTYAPSAAGMDWGQFTSTFVAQSSNTTLTIKGLVAGGGQELGLDNVSITQSASAYEPSTGELCLPVAILSACLLKLRRRVGSI